MVNALTRETGAKLGPLLLETLVKHYFERLLKDSAVKSGSSTKLRKDELLYDEAFIIVKTFLEAASKHPVEELQRFSNTRTPSPPWVHVVRLVVPMSCCDEAAEILVKVLGGEETTKRLVGGTKWWQVRGVKGVDAEWIATKKDWEHSEKKYKAHQKDQKDKESRERSATSSPEMNDEEGSAPYEPSMDEMRCILYLHGGGYFFGSVDQERYAIQRFARKINGRAFAINYRLAPQYPFPCALQDAIAAYLFLIRPPEGAAHRPVKPENIVIAGDSAGGGLSLALLQVIRDSGLPNPAGGVLVSPWSDMTHSFPSIHTNTATDVMPPYGLSFYKPSTLWPPPPDEMTVTVREGLRSRIRQAVTLTTDAKPDTSVPLSHTHSRSRSGSRSRSRSRPAGPHDSAYDLRLPQTGQTLHLGSTASLPIVSAGVRDQTVTCVAENGEMLSIPQQIHLYTPNYMLGHPLVSPAVSYLGGLPPLFIVAGDGEVLRDEIIYLAHKAAHPERFPVNQTAKDMYPVLNGIEERFPIPTQVHLQVYDDAAHVLPILFSFTTPAKYCFRAMALFIRQVTGMLGPSPSSSQPDNINIPITLSPPTSPRPDASFEANTSGASSSNSLLQLDTERLAAPAPRAKSRSRSSPPSREPSPNASSIGRRRSLFRRDKKKGTEEEQHQLASPTTTSSRLSFRTFFRSSMIVESPASELGPSANNPTPSVGASSTPNPGLEDTPRESSGDVGGPRFRGSGIHHEPGVRKAGESSVYQNGLTNMIRERVSTHGIIRPLEPESELAAFSLQPERIGQVSELAMRRYFDAKAKFDRKFGGTYKTIEKNRQKHLEKAHKDAMRNMAQLQNYIHQDEKKEREGESAAGTGAGAAGGKGETLKGVKEGLVASGSWSWAWALDLDEKPPPSSIVARRDTHEAVELARIADQAVLAEENILSGNSLWSLMVNFLTTTPDKDKEKHKAGRKQEEAQKQGDGDAPRKVDVRESKRERVRSRFAQLLADLRKHPERVPAQVADTSAPVSQQNSQSTSVSNSTDSTT